MAPTSASFPRKQGWRSIWNLSFQGKPYNKNSADIVGKKKLLMLIKSNFSFSHINVGSYSSSSSFSSKKEKKKKKKNIAYIPQ